MMFTTNAETGKTINLVQGPPTKAFQVGGLGHGAGQAIGPGRGAGPDARRQFAGGHQVGDQDAPIDTPFLLVKGFPPKAGKARRTPV
jgi:hypothetical protein